ncbi:ABC transporter permease [Actinoplanes italicus]|uniref:Peptide/nickel transport system permease protein n=1 Tax=Actinoplanes italicus TaxID=113567 RepID=A0A2T0KD81_9ACTN|nr:ABC transporter permease [Actinoplanes italicus]PRX21249.1 peptide/nickel transport system permease protein [Actinoplanes italicus]GIE36412.1 ABC transporter permease [Actinoplanes italicus]
MLRFLIKRLLLASTTLVAISIVTFLLFFAVPSSPAWVMCGRNCSPERIAQVEKSLGLDQPLPVQYTEFVKGIFVGRTIDDAGTLRECDAPCLGYSFRSKEPVTDTISRSLPVTVSIVVGAMVVFLTVGIGLGMLAALKKGTVFDRAAIGASVGFASTQTYTLGGVLLLVFVYSTGLLPNPHYTPITQDPLDWAAGMLLPWITLGLINSALYARLSRAQMIETLQEDFVRTARAKGLPARVVTRRHALRAAITPIVTIAGVDLGGYLGGVVITESVFSLNGIGREAADAVADLNLPLVMATVLLAAFFIVTMNIIVDMLYAVIDPRVRLG